MSVALLKSLLSDARTELNTLVRHVNKLPTLSEKTLAALSYSHQRISDKIGDAIKVVKQPLTWKNPESGTWRARHNKLEISVFRDAGRYHWQINSTDNSAPCSFDEAEDVIMEILGLE